MDDVFFPEELECLQDLDCEASYQREGHALEVVVLDELVEVDGEEFEGDDQVRAEGAVVQDLDDVVRVVGVLVLQVLQDFEFHSSLVLVPLLVLDDLHRHHLLCLVVQALESLSKAAFAEEVQHLKSIRDVVLQNDLVITVFVVIPVVVVLARFAPDLVIGSFQTQAVHLFVVK